MNGLGSAGVAKGLDLLATIIKEGKRLFANVYLALELVISSFSYLRCEVEIKFQFGRVSGFPYDFNYDNTWLYALGSIVQHVTSKEICSKLILIRKRSVESLKFDLWVILWSPDFKDKLPVKL